MTALWKNHLRVLLQTPVGLHDDRPSAQRRHPYLYQVSFSHPMSEYLKSLLQQQLWNVANTLRDKMNVD
jgi:hypothetical protein